MADMPRPQILRLGRKAENCVDFSGRKKFARLWRRLVTQATSLPGSRPM
jgi:hypothetical protein